MKISIETRTGNFLTDLSKPIDISRPLAQGEASPTAYFANPPKFEPVVSEDFIGKVTAGSPVNFLNVSFNPHGNGTHTECIGHILPTNENLALEPNTINKRLKEFHCLCWLITVNPLRAENGDFVIRLSQVLQLAEDFHPDCKAIAFRTSPNDSSKITSKYSGSNPAYFHYEVLAWAAESGLEHFLTDMPSVDREEDGGKLLAHRSFWNVDTAPRENATITEMIFVPDSVPDGLYLLNLQIAPFEMDAAPSKPMLYILHPEPNKFHID